MYRLISTSICALFPICASLFSLTASANYIECTHYEGSGAYSSVSFDGETAVIGGQRWGCGAVPAYISSRREFPEGFHLITATCGSDGGGIYAREPSPVSIYRSMDSAVFYAEYGGGFYRCDPGFPR